MTPEAAFLSHTLAHALFPIFPTKLNPNLQSNTLPFLCLSLHWHDFSEILVLSFASSREIAGQKSDKAGTNT